MVDFSKPSGKRRFFIYDLQRGKRVMSSYCMHGSGEGNTDAKPKFSNDLGSGCSSLGRYVMVGKGRKFKNSIRLCGLDRTNNHAEARGILIHSAGKVTRFSGEKKYIPIGSESLGCFTVSRDCMAKVMKIYRSSSKEHPVIVFAKYDGRALMDTKDGCPLFAYGLRRASKRAGFEIKIVSLRLRSQG